MYTRTRIPTLVLADVCNSGQTEGVVVARDGAGPPIIPPPPPPFSMFNLRRREQDSTSIRSSLRCFSVATIRESYFE